MFVKIEGITSEDDALLAVAMGADAIGFVFAPSPRQVAPQVASDIAKRLPPEVLTIGVFRDEAPQRVVDVVLGAGLRGAQLHGHETPEQARAVRRRVPWVAQAFSGGDPRVRQAAEWGVDAVVLDAARPGSGQVFDWALAAELPPDQRLIVAGGLTPSNVAAAIERTRPWGVDVASGVEASPGRKDPVKLRSFIAAARAAAEASDDTMPLATGRHAPYDWQEDRA